MSNYRIYEIADEMGVDSKVIIDILDELGMEDLTPLNTVEEEEHELIKEYYEEDYEEDEEAEEEETESEEEEVPSRPPVISILGHIDHGKTTLLDRIREANKVDREAGGITQSIGAYQIEWDGKPLTFIDTPGHKAFTAMRARGAQATDLAVLVVAADDGIMNETEEALDHIEAADIPMIVAINKIDKSNADVNRVMQEMSQHGLNPDEWGGDTVTVSVSALKGENIDELLDMIVLLSKMEDLKGDPEAPLDGFIVESHLEPRKGPLATAVIKQGTLESRDILVVGDTHGRVRSLSDQEGQIEKAKPGDAVVIMGLDDVPDPGTELESYEDLAEAKETAQRRKEEKKEQQRGEKPSVEDMFAQAQKDQLDLILKAETSGALDAVEKELKDIDFEDVDINVLRKRVGNISEDDVMFASSSDNYSAVVGFGVDVREQARLQADQLGIATESFDIIYDLVTRIKQAIGEIKGPQYEETKIGEVEVREIFDITDVGKIAGCYVTDGKVENDSKIKVWRDGEKIHEGNVETLRRFQEDVGEVGKDLECGIRIQDFGDVEEGDLLEVYSEKQVSFLE